MQNKIYILLLFILLFGCKKNNSDLYKKIKGDWRTKRFKDNFTNRAYTFTFQDSVCSIYYPFGEFSKYRIIDDTLFVRQRIFKHRNYNKAIKIYTKKFKIIDITPDKLFLMPVEIKRKDYSIQSRFHNNDTIKLSRIKKYKNWDIKRIGFYSTICLGSCPSMYLEIDSIGNMLYNGEMYTNKEGLYTGIIPEKEWSIIKSKVNNINLDKLEEKYSAMWTDDQTCGIIIETNNKTYKSSAYGYNKEPIELRLLFHKLIEIYKNVDLKKDTTIINKFHYKDMKFIHK